MTRIAYFGPAGTFTEMALAAFEDDGVLRRAGLGEDVTRVPARSQAAAIEMVRAGEAEAAVVPIESSVEGSVSATLDALAVGARVQIIAEVELDIAFTIVARAPMDWRAVRTVSSYPVATAQVTAWLAANMPQAQVQLASSNSAAAEDVANGLADAAVSTALAARRNRLTVLADRVADYAGARTRFVLIVPPRVAPARTGADRTSVVFELPNEPGSLMRAFAEFATRGIDLSRIESRPTRVVPGTFRFFLDCAGHVDDSPIAEALKALHRGAQVRYLGSWPSANAGSPPPSDGDAAQWLEAIRAGVPG